MLHSRLTRGRRSYLSLTASISTITSTYFCHSWPLLLDIVFRESDLPLLRTEQRAASPLREVGEKKRSQVQLMEIFWEVIVQHDWCATAIHPVVQQADIGLLCLPLDRARENRDAKMKFFDSNPLQARNSHYLMRPRSRRKGWHGSQ